MTTTRGREPGLIATLALYAVARLAVVAVVAALLALAGVPVLLAVLIGLIVALPLSMVLFKGLRARLDAAVAVTRDRRAAERELLRSRLRGDAGPGSDGSAATAERQSPGGQG
jgi:hypothetical protein